MTLKLDLTDRGSLETTASSGMTRASSPHIWSILEAVGKAHPTPKVAKAARKAAFKLRSRRQSPPP